MGKLPESISIENDASSDVSDIDLPSSRDDNFEENDNFNGAKIKSGKDSSLDQSDLPSSRDDNFKEDHSCNRAESVSEDLELPSSMHDNFKGAETKSENYALESSLIQRYKGALDISKTGLCSSVVFFDLETVCDPPFYKSLSPSDPPRIRGIIEIAASTISLPSQVEVDCYATLVRPVNGRLLLRLPEVGTNEHSITRGMLSTYPTFPEIANHIYNILHRKTWVGHNINAFDKGVLNDAFIEAGMTPPVPLGIVDTFHTLKLFFGDRAENFKLATLSRYFSLGPQLHRALFDVRMNVKVFQKCGFQLLLEAGLDYSTSSDSEKAKRRKLSPVRIIRVPGLTVPMPDGGGLSIAAVRKGLLECVKKGYLRRI